jgi:hypothetical protein
MRGAFDKSREETLPAGQVLTPLGLVVLLGNAFVWLIILYSFGVAGQYLWRLAHS